MTLENYLAEFHRRHGRKARGIVCIDGLNFYRRALRGTKFKWLDLQEWSRKTLTSACKIIAVHYFTSEVKSASDAEAPSRQGVYLRALKDWSNGRPPVLRIHEGASQWKKQRGRIVGNSWAEEVCRTVGLALHRVWAQIRRRPPPDSRMGDVKFPEEKQTDANLAAQMVADAAARDRCDFLVLVSTDSDFVGVCGMIRKQFGKKVFLVVPPNMDRKRAGGKRGVDALRKNVDGVAHILEKNLSSSQMNDEFQVGSGKRAREHKKPRSWR